MTEWSFTADWLILASLALIIEDGQAASQLQFIFSFRIYNREGNIACSYDQTKENVH